MCHIPLRGSPGPDWATAFSRRRLPAENGIAWMLTRLVGHGVAADLLLFGRAVQADEALALGLVNRAVDSDEFLP
jgi:enoyl-CoA hydratase/carnithine racemase